VTLSDASALVTVMGELRRPPHFFYYKILADTFTNVQGRPKTRQLIVRFSIIFLTGQNAKKNKLSGQKPDTWWQP